MAELSTNSGLIIQEHVKKKKECATCHFRAHSSHLIELLLFFGGNNIEKQAIQKRNSFLLPGKVLFQIAQINIMNSHIITSQELFSGARCIKSWI